MVSLPAVVSRSAPFFSHFQVLGAASATPAQIKMNTIQALLFEIICTNNPPLQLIFFDDVIPVITAIRRLIHLSPTHPEIIFAGLDAIIQTNLWELDQNDALRFAKLAANRQVACLGTHDLVAHLAGLTSAQADTLARVATRVEIALEQYFRNAKERNRTSLVIPYLIGVLLDDLAQPVHFGSIKHQFMLEQLITLLEQNVISPNESRSLLKFPKDFGGLIEFTRNDPENKVLSEGPDRVQSLLQALLSGSVTVGSDYSRYSNRSALDPR